MYKRFILPVLILTICLLAAAKPHFGGNIRVASELLDGLGSQMIFRTGDGAPVPLLQIPYEKTPTRLSLDLSFLDPTAQVEVQQAVSRVKETTHPCHWILDYPFLSHQHPTTLEYADGKLVLQTSDEDTLTALMNSPCLVPESFSFTQAFQKTQFGFEANMQCRAGRPFLSSITPVDVDPVNPYLSFKLNDVDVIPVPEERFQMVSQDADVAVLAGPRFFVYLKFANLNPSQIQGLISAIHVQEIISAALNDHAEVPANLTSPQTAVPLAGITIHLTAPSEQPYGLIGDRIEVQWKQAGIQVDRDVPIHGAPQAELRFKQIDQASEDLFRYLLLRNELKTTDDRAWFDVWDELLASGKLEPLLTYTSKIAARKSIRDLSIKADGLPDFTNCWVSTP